MIPLRIRQQELEQEFSRSNIRAKVKADIQAATGNIAMKIAIAATDITNYLAKSYYKAKQARINEFLSQREPMLADEIVMEILIAVLPLQGSQPIQGVVAKLAPMLGHDDPYASIIMASELVSICCLADLFNIIPARDSDSGSLMIVNKYSLDEATLQFIANTQYMPPMICRPNVINANSDCGYLTLNESVILGAGNHHNLVQNLNTLNTLNNIELSLDTRMLAFDEPLKLKKNKDGSELTKAQIADRTLSHQRMTNSSKQVYDLLLAEHNKFYLTWKYDKRGRVYSQGYHCNIQGSSYKKAIINLTKQEVITC